MDWVDARAGFTLCESCVEDFRRITFPFIRHDLSVRRADTKGKVTNTIPLQLRHRLSFPCGVCFVCLMSERLRVRVSCPPVRRKRGFFSYFLFAIHEPLYRVLREEVAPYRSCFGSERAPVSIRGDYANSLTPCPFCMSVDPANGW